MAIAEDNNVIQLTESGTHDLRSLLCSTERDFVIRNNGEHVSNFGVAAINLLFVYGTLSLALLVSMVVLLSNI